MEKVKKLLKSDRRIFVAVIAAGVGLVILAGLMALGGDDKNNASKDPGSSTQSQQPTTTVVTWRYDDTQSRWISSATAPSCASNHVLTKSPVNVSKATAIYYPGQSRGGNYMTHGGFKFDGSVPADIKVSMPVDATVIGGSRYIESGETQYLFDFQTECGIAFRFDHILTPSPIFQQIATAFKEAKADDKSGTFISPAVSLKAGDEIATAVGHTKPNNSVSLDFGVYDYRTQNSASKNTTFAAQQGDSSATTFYGVCWFDMLPAADAAKVKTLPSADKSAGKKSDYCK